MIRLYTANWTDATNPTGPQRRDLGMTGALELPCTVFGVKAKGQVPDLATVRAWTAAARYSQNVGGLVLDLDACFSAWINESESEVIRMSVVARDVLQAMREAVPWLRIGMYQTPPWMPPQWLIGSTANRWVWRRRWRDVIWPVLCGHVDFLCPSLYCAGPTSKAWRDYAEIVIGEADNTGLAIHPFLDAWRMSPELLTSALDWCADRGLTPVVYGNGTPWDLALPRCKAIADWVDR